MLLLSQPPFPPPGGCRLSQWKRWFNRNTGTSWRWVWRDNSVPVKNTPQSGQGNAAQCPPHTAKFCYKTGVLSFIWEPKAGKNSVLIDTPHGFQRAWPVQPCILFAKWKRRNLYTEKQNSWMKSSRRLWSWTSPLAQTSSFVSVSPCHGTKLGSSFQAQFFLLPEIKKIFSISILFTTRRPNNPSQHLSFPWFSSVPSHLWFTSPKGHVCMTKQSRQGNGGAESEMVWSCQGTHSKA